MSARVLGVAFDLGRTLLRVADTERANLARLSEWAAARGLSSAERTAAAALEARAWMWEETVRTGRQHTASEAIARAAHALGWPSGPDLLAEARRAFFAPEIEAAELYWGARRALLVLARRGLRVGLVSNASDHQLVEAILERTGLRGLLEPVVSSASVGRIKPGPEIFMELLSQWGVDARSCVMVGDDPVADIEGAARIGMRTIHLNRAGPEGGARADAVATSLRTVVRTILRWRAEGRDR